MPVADEFVGSIHFLADRKRYVATLLRRGVGKVHRMSGWRDPLGEAGGLSIDR